jgi:hypothetical protein
VKEAGDLIAEIERDPQLPLGEEERFDGYGVMSCPFDSGHILCLRRFTASSVGPAYTSVWHRDPDSQWSFYQNAPPTQSCPRYFSSALANLLVCDVSISWIGRRSFSVTIPSPFDLEWHVELGATLATLMLNRTSTFIPDRLWRNARFLGAMSRTAGVALGAGNLSLAGEAPNGQMFVANPRLVWTIQKSRVRSGGYDYGSVTTMQRQARLGDFWIPARGLFAIGRAFFEPFNPQRHRTPA